MKVFIQAITCNFETSYCLCIGHQSFQFNYVHDDTSNDTATDQSLWYADQLKIALKKAGCNEVEIILTNTDN